MSMIGNLLLISDREADELLADPRRIHVLLTRRVYEAPSPKDYLDLDKAWHFLHFALTGTAWEGPAPLNFLASGGTPVGDEDCGYGPARLLKSTEVASLADVLEGVSPEDLMQRYDARRMEALELYPGGWGEVEATAEALGYFTDAYELLRELVRQGAHERRAMLVWLA